MHLTESRLYENTSKVTNFIKISFEGPEKGILHVDDDACECAHLMEAGKHSNEKFRKHSSIHMRFSYF